MSGYGRDGREYQYGHAGELSSIRKHMKSAMEAFVEAHNRNYPEEGGPSKELAVETLSRILMDSADEEFEK